MSITYTAKKGLKLIGTEVGAWLADTTAETVVGAELIVNGDFPINVSGWIAGTGITVTHDTTIYTSGGMKVTMGATTAQGSSQSFTTVVGKLYVISCDAYAPSSNTTVNAAVISIDANGATVGDGESDHISSEDASQGLKFGFIATAITTTVYVFVLNRGIAWGVSGDVAYFDNITCKLADNDLSANDHDLAYYGSITKSPVETGSTVMGYSGFSAANYLEQSYDSALDFGAGDFSVRGWFRSSNKSVGLFDRKRTGWTTEPRLQIQLSSTGYLGVFMTSAHLNSATVDYSDNVWRFVVITKSSNILYAYVNGVLTDSIANTDTNTDASAVTRMGVQIQTGGYTNDHEQALWSVLPSALTATQIKTIYDSEKHMFKENSVFTQVDEEYSLDLSLDRVNRSEDITSKESVSIGGNQETVFQRADVLYDINIKNIPKASLPAYRVWLQSVNAGETFTFDPYGTIASEDDPVSVIADGGHKESRNGTLEYFNISVKMREV